MAGPPPSERGIKPIKLGIGEKKVVGEITVTGRGDGCLEVTSTSGFEGEHGRTDRVPVSGKGRGTYTLGGPGIGKDVTFEYDTGVESDPPPETGSDPFHRF